jgi:type III secretory pathway component EscS
MTQIKQQSLNFITVKNIKIYYIMLIIKDNLLSRIISFRIKFYVL